MFFKNRLFLSALFLVVGGTLLPFIFLKDIYPFHRFGMFAEPVKYQTQEEKFYIFYKIDKEFVALKPQTIPINANAFEMQLRKHHYQKKHTDFIAVFDRLLREKANLPQEKKIKWKWYHVIQKQNSKNEFDSLCVFSN